jgi:hypothetical protein
MFRHVRHENFLERAQLMKLSTIVIATAGVLMAALSAAGPASAGVDIGWTWNNNNDQDARGKFVSNGDQYWGTEYEGNDYLNWDSEVNGDGKWNIPGSETGVDTKLSVNLDEGTSAYLQVCETKTAAPNDCSSWKKGVA